MERCLHQRLYMQRAILAHTLLPLLLLVQLRPVRHVLEVLLHCLRQAEIERVRSLLPTYCCFSVQPRVMCWRCLSR
jgi:hypothetical protein